MASFPTHLGHLNMIVASMLADGADLARFAMVCVEWHRVARLAAGYQLCRHELLLAASEGMEGRARRTHVPPYVRRIVSIPAGARASSPGGARLFTGAGNGALQLLDIGAGGEQPSARLPF